MRLLLLFAIDVLLLLLMLLPSQAKFSRKTKEQVNLYNHGFNVGAGTKKVVIKTLLEEKGRFRTLFSRLLDI